ncbi:radical SAM protein [Pyrococcus sp. ST04]|uniref:radical SAM protein n=1 Tax=Pyrococcus sp. ST04 TaxID=1183377 RepID=UPI0002605B3C|nr:radical SAM protein [Pyrococcus sp. ST04]AFK22857.1 putative radical SAM domain-containing protein [Pyrococcus sp. ST04]
MKRLERAIIGPSSHVSALCHSIVRGEPFSTCSVGCIYCYARWYRGPHGEAKPIWDVIKVVKALGSIKRENLLIPPIRFSTLSDPFQGKAKVTLKALKVAFKEKIPVIINTKLIPGQKHIDVIEKLADEGLLIFQISISAVRNAKVLEPFAPSPEERVELIRKLSEMGIPTIVRLQPFIPGAIPSIHEFLESLAWAGAKMVILEFLRIERQLLNVFKRIFPEEKAYSLKWESYLPGTPSEKAPILQLPLEYKYEIAREISNTAKKLGMAFSTCKEGMFDLHHPLTLDCCGMGFLEVEYSRRPTLWDLYVEILEKGSARKDDLWERCKREHLLCKENLNPYPRWFRRGFIAHEKRLESILKKPHIIERIAPALKYDKERGEYIKR